MQSYQWGLSIAIACLPNLPSPVPSCITVPVEFLIVGKMTRGVLPDTWM